MSARQDNFPTLQLTITGLDDVILVGHKLPDIPIEAIMPLVHSLRDIGVEEDGFSTVVESGMKSPHIPVNPRRPTPDDLMSVLRQAY